MNKLLVLPLLLFLLLTASCSKNEVLEPVSSNKTNVNSSWNKDSTESNPEIEKYNEIINNNPNDADAYYSRGLVKFDLLGDSKGTIEDINKAISINPRNAVFYYGRGMVKDNSGDYKGAVKDHNKAIKLNPEYADAYYARGLAQIRLKEYKLSLKDLNIAKELNPNLSNEIDKKIKEVLSKQANSK